MEQRLVGTWVIRAGGRTLAENNERPKPGEAVTKFVYSSDHRFISSWSADQTTVTGTWKIEGDFLIQHFNGSSRVERTRILRLTNTDLVFTDGHGTEGHWWRLVAL
jgi:hypothetical protein